MKLLIVTYKLCYRVGNSHYTVGGTPSEFNALAEHVDLLLLASIVDRSSVGEGWQIIDPRVKCFSLGRIAQLGTFPPPVGAMIRSKKAVRNILDEHSPDLVLLKGPSEVTFAPIDTIRKAGIPSIYHYSLDWIEDVRVSSRKSLLRRCLFPYFYFARLYRQAVLRWAIPRVDALATVSSPYAKLMSRYRKEPILQLSSTFTTTERDIVDTPSERSFPHNRFMFVGRIDRNKNLQLIAQALRIIQTRRPGNEIVVDIIGKGAEYENVSRLASELGVGHQMNQIGYIHNEQLRDYYEKGYAVILPSFSETLGKVILEAYTVGTPAIASNVGGIPDLVQDGVNGYLIDPHDATQLADRMLAMIDSPEAYRQMQISATGTAHKWTREVSLQHWLKTLSEVISKFSKR